MDLTKDPFDLADDFQDTPKRFLLLWFPGQFTQIGPAFDQFFVADVHWNKDQRAGVFANKAANRHAQDAGFRRERFSIPATASFNEILEREATGQDLSLIHI